VNKTILCVEDERFILGNHIKILTDSGYAALSAETVAQAREHLAAGTPDAIVLDIMLPDGNGLDLLSELREAGSKIPIIMLTAWGKSSDVARGLRLGANDYISKPFEYEVLLARLEAMFRNVEQVPETVTRGSLTLKPTSREAFVNGADLLLTTKEYTLLQFFVQNENRIMSAEYVYESVWGQPMAGDSQALSIAVSRLRKKITGCGYTISAEYGTGYCFECGES
jgi:DNA-binding response OmpR family regulator